MELQVKVTKEAYELASGIAKFVEAVKLEIEDNEGWKLGDDLAGIIAAAMSHLLPALDGVMKIGDEKKEDQLAFLNGISLGLMEIANIFLVKKENDNGKA